jgi:hypothetical protein
MLLTETGITIFTEDDSDLLTEDFVYENPSEDPSSNPSEDPSSDPTSDDPIYLTVGINSPFISQYYISKLVPSIVNQEFDWAAFYVDLKRINRVPDPKKPIVIFTESSDIVDRAFELPEGIRIRPVSAFRRSKQ